MLIVVVHLTQPFEGSNHYLLKFEVTKMLYILIVVIVEWVAISFSNIFVRSQLYS